MSLVPSAHPSTESGPAAPPSVAAAVFNAIADRLATRTDDLVVFTGTGCSFAEWTVWESVTALHGHRAGEDVGGSGSGWTVQPHPRYAEMGVTGSRETADLLVFDPASGRRVLVELAILQDWSRNKWIDMLDGDTERLGRAIATDVVPLQIVIAASLVSAIEVNPVWQQWLGMSKIWCRPTSLHRAMALGPVGQLTIQGWVAGDQ
ncbi:MAG: hypothetical protein HKO59_11725 [Phycisphaerales bacterium]|nr:hypothetical protein [Phycisphaerae bacterium]NNF41527.1 hypothetical protein [Phycisphaerales bacterium]NNM26632.1 hypothetical protein [Phycisphaerales bacterium]